MCGVLGVVTQGSEARPEGVERGLASLTHRGPDARGVRTIVGPGSSCVLGHTRLRIIDLSPDADQPMPNEDGSVWVVFNGEIYNHIELRGELEGTGHRFRSRSDTEVLVHLFEDAGNEPARMLSRLRGMFAFAVFDARDGRLLLARDRLGIKPLYWAARGGGLAFSSEVRALARAGLASGDPDAASVAGYLLWGVVPGPGTILAGVRELPPGCFLEWHGGSARVQRWWRPEVRPDPETLAGAERLVGAALREAVGRHLVADRPVGVFLSGGVDSGSVATLAAREERVRALTVTFPETGDDEGEAAAALAARLGAEHERVPVRGEDVARSVLEVLTAMDQPTSDGLNTWLVCRAAREAGLVVALSGLGGDELFGGYPSFRLVPRLVRLGGLLGRAPRPARRAASRAASRTAPGGRTARVLAAEPGYEGAYLAVRGLFAPDELGIEGEPPHPWNGSGFPGDPRDRVMLLEATRYLPAQLLRDTDQMSMAHALEVRVPLLDDVVVALALRVPASVRTAPGKALLARATGLDGAAAKRPFALPMDRWMRGPLRETVREALLSRDLPFADLPDAPMRTRLWRTFEAGRMHWSRAWAVSVLRLWPEANGFGW